MALRAEEAHPEIMTIVRYARQELGMSQGEFFVAYVRGTTGIPSTSQQLQMWDQGKNEPRYSTIKALADVFNPKLEEKGSDFRIGTTDWWVNSEGESVERPFWSSDPSPGVVVPFPDITNV